MFPPLKIHQDWILSNHFEEQCKEWDLVTLLKSNPPDFAKLNRDYLPEEFQNSTAEDLKDVAMVKKERRDYLVSQIRNTFVMLIDTGFVNPIDSVFLSGISRF